MGILDTGTDPHEINLMAQPNIRSVKLWSPVSNSFIVSTPVFVSLAGLSNHTNNMKTPIGEVGQAAYSGFRDQLRETINLRDESLPRIKNCGGFHFSKFPNKNTIMVAMEYKAGHHITLRLPLADVVFGSHSASVGVPRIDNMLPHQLNYDKGMTPKVFEYSDPDFFKKLSETIVKRYVLIGTAQNEVLRARAGYAWIGTLAGVTTCLSMLGMSNPYMETAAVVTCLLTSFFILKESVISLNRIKRIWSSDV